MNVNARFDGHCRLQKMTGCNGIKKGELIRHESENWNSHMSCKYKVDSKLRRYK